MYKVGTKLVIKTLDELVANNDLKKTGFPGVYKNEESRFCILDTFPFWGTPVVIQSIDEKDHDIPYFVSEGLWLPEFMLKKVEEKPKVPQKDDKIKANPNIKIDPNFKPDVVYMNNFVGRPFGPMFMKLIKLDVKIAEFSNTALSKLKRVELDYIYKVLVRNGYPEINLKETNAQDLCKTIFDIVKDLDV